MCDSSAYVIKNGAEEFIMSSLEKVTVEGDTIVMSNIFGEKKQVSGRIIEVDYSENKVIIE